MINDNKEFREKLSVIDPKVGELTNLKRKWISEEQSINCGKTSLTPSTNYNNIIDEIIETERNMHRLEQYFRLECVETAGILSSTTNDLLEGHVLLIFEKLSVLLEAMDLVACHR